MTSPAIPTPMPSAPMLSIFFPMWNEEDLIVRTVSAGRELCERHPIGLGPYRFVRMNPGQELVLEANDQYWRKKASIKRLVFKGVPDRTTRLAMLKTGEADIGYLMVGVEAATIKADPKLRLARVIPTAVWWMEFPEQWNPKSPWADRRVRLAATMAVDKQAVNEAERLGFPSPAARSRGATHGHDESRPGLAGEDPGIPERGVGAGRCPR